jgi:uncharacterized protein with von Willebrand factor type A (vWA) domain
MKSSYFAYFNNTPGSRKAISECVKKTDAELKAEEDEKKEKKERKLKENEQKQQQQKQQPMAAKS